MDKEKEICVGDVVVLKSGGPEMTAGYTELGYIVCYWFKDDVPASQKFPSQALIHYKPTQPIVSA